MKRNTVLFRIEDEYRNISKFLARASADDMDEPDAHAEYMHLMKERARLKDELWKLGSKDLVLKIDNDCIQEQLNSVKLRWGRDEL